MHKILIDHFSFLLSFLCLFLFNSEVRPLLHCHPANLSAERGGLPLLLLLILGGLAGLPDQDGAGHAGDHLVPGTVELGQRDDLTQSGLVEAVQEPPRLGTEEVDGSELSLLVVGELGVGIAAGEHDVGQGMPAGLDRSEVLELSVGVGDGSHQGEVRRLVDSQLTVLVRGQQFVSGLRGEVGAVDRLVVVELGQGGLRALDLPDVPDLDSVFSTTIGRGQTRLDSHWSRGSKCCYASNFMP